MAAFDDVVIISGCRTAVGKFQGSLSDLSAPQLGATVVREAVKTMPSERKCKCGSALAHSLITDFRLVPAKTKKNLAAIIGKYLS